MKTDNNSWTALKTSSSAQRAHAAAHIPKQTPSEASDKKLLLRQMAMTLCRQYIMWPTSGPLPCQKGIDCDKSASCQKMAEDVVDYASGFK